MSKCLFTSVPTETGIKTNGKIYYLSKPIKDLVSVAIRSDDANEKKEILMKLMSYENTYDKENLDLVNDLLKIIQSSISQLKSNGNNVPKQTNNTTSQVTNNEGVKPNETVVKEAPVVSQPAPEKVAPQKVNVPMPEQKIVNNTTVVNSGFNRELRAKNLRTLGGMLMFLALVALILAIVTGCMYTGLEGFYETYGGDAYTGIQNAAAKTASNVWHTNGLIQCIGIGSFVFLSLACLFTGIYCRNKAKEYEVE